MVNQIRNKSNGIIHREKIPTSRNFNVIRNMYAFSAYVLPYIISMALFKLYKIPYKYYLS